MSDDLREEPIVAPSDAPTESMPQPTPAAQRAAAFERLLDGIAANPRTYDFFAVLRRVASLHPEWPSWGRAARPAHEALRLSQDAELDFAPAALSRLDRDARPAPRLGVRFFGLFGSHGPLPLHVTESVRERTRVHSDPTMARFLDIFHHRLLTFFYRAWAQGQPTAQLDRPADDRFAAWLGAGFGLEPGAATGALPADAQLFQAGLLGGRSRHPEGLQKCLGRYFGVPVRIEEHVAQWLVLEAGDRSRLGLARNRTGGDRGEPARLGVSACSGSKVHDRQFKFRVVFGPLTLDRYLALIPGGPAWRAAGAWIGHYAGADLRWDVRLVLRRQDVPAPRLGRHVRLGLTAWIGHPRDAGDRGDLCLRPRSCSLDRRPAAHHA